ncbi:hypothetical protein F511_13188 [Dorcoceras hygrometricum]|uniref:DNA-directed RNA polymerase V subunit 1 n=1 Tax=Dorcoceras hygrometricum TaxID=472368 RepID=A0A2Z7B8W3_9LAMI|nr:hypothetical protein F511_13188 [Dorcoceras hygrometricum]
MVVDLIGIYGLKGPYCTLTTTNWFLQALSVIPRGSWGDVARRSYHDPMGKVRNCDPGATMVVGPRLAVSLNHWSHKLKLHNNKHNLTRTLTVKALVAAAPPLFKSRRRRRRRRLAPPPPPCFPGNCSGQLDEENPSVLISSGLLVQADEGVSLPVVDLIDAIYRRLP